MEYNYRNSTGFVNLMNNSPCMRCGQFHLRGQCRAVNAQCFNCSRVGHFKVVCWFKGNVVKSVKSKQRDAERMQTFIFRKTLEVLPFWDVPNDELSSFFPKNTGMVEQCQVKLQKAHVAALCDKEENVKTKSNLHVKLGDAQNLLSREQQRRQDAEQKVHTVEVQMERIEERLTCYDQQTIDLENKTLNWCRKIKNKNLKLNS